MSKEVLTEGYKTRERILTPQSAKRFDVILLGWLLTGYILGILVNAYDISFSDCTICTSISAYAPSIHKMAVGSRYPEAMHFIWLYYILTLPIVLTLFFIFVREFNRRVISGLGVIFLIGGGLFGAYVCIKGIGFGSEGGGFDRLYHRYLIYAAFIACASSGAVVIAIFHLVHHIIGSIKNEPVNNRK